MILIVPAMITEERQVTKIIPRTVEAICIGLVSSDLGLYGFDIVELLVELAPASYPGCVTEAVPFKGLVLEAFNCRVVQCSSTKVTLGAYSVVSLSLSLDVLCRLVNVPLDQIFGGNLCNHTKVHEEMESVDQLPLYSLDVEMPGCCPRLPSDLIESFMELIHHCDMHVLVELQSSFWVGVEVLTRANPVTVNYRLKVVLVLEHVLEGSDLPGWLNFWQYFSPG